MNPNITGLWYRYDLKINASVGRAVFVDICYSIIVLCSGSSFGARPGASAVTGASTGARTSAGARSAESEVGFNPDVRKSVLHCLI